MALPRIITKGRLAKAPELKEVGDYKKVEFSVASSKKYKDLEKTCFLNCEAWNGTAEFINNYFTKGQEIYLEGTMETQSWKNDEGQTRSRQIVLVDTIDFCGKKGDNTAANEGSKAEDFVGVSDSEAEELPFK